MATRIAQLERREEGEVAGVVVWGIRRVNYWTQEGPDVVTIPATGEVTTESGFRARYPLGLLVVRQAFGRGDGAGGRADRVGTPL